MTVSCGSAKTVSFNNRLLIIIVCMIHVPSALPGNSADNSGQSWPGKIIIVIRFQDIVEPCAHF